MKKGLLMIALAAMSMMCNAQSITDSLLFYFPFDGNASDMSGNGFHGAEMGGIALTADRDGNTNSAYQFDGIDDYINIAHNAAYKVPLPVTYSAWISLSDSSLPSQIVANDNSTNLYAGINMNVITGRASASFGNGAGAGTASFRETIQASYVLNSNNWHHLVIILNAADSMEVYIDGVLDTAATYSGTGNTLAYTTADASIGMRYHTTGGADQYFSGKIDEVACWHRSLTAEEVKTIYDMPANIVMAISMDGNANDISLYGNHGTENGGISLTKNRFGEDDMAYQFDGADDFIEITADASFQVGFPFSYSSWVRIDLFKTIPIFYGNDQASVYAGGWLQFVDGTLASGIGNNAGAGSQFRRSISSQDSIALTNWNQVVAVFNSINDMEIYVNGELDTTTAISGNAASIVYNNLPALIGKTSNPFGSDVHYIGDMDEVVVYSKALTSVDINNYFIPGVYFSEHPTALTKIEDMSASFSAKAVGTGSDLTYQWQKDNVGTWTDVSGATSVSLSLSSVAIADAGMYRCKATSYGVVAYSNEVQLTVTAVDEIAALQQAVSISPNPSSGVLNITLNGEEGFQYCVYNLMGSVVTQGNTPQANTTIDLSAFQNGIYLLEVAQHDQKIMKRIIKK